jgi:ABC-2 type transport system ATP-binding protein
MRDGPFRRNVVNCVHPVQQKGIVARNLVKRFGPVTAVESADFEINRGEIVGFLGHNGAGKTTTMRMICGVLPPTSGSILVDGYDIASHRRKAASLVGYLPESSPLYPEMRVREYLGFRARLYGVPDARSAIESAQDRCGLTSASNRLIGQLSRGYRQRVGLAAAILHDPSVLILDEVTSGLDPLQVIEVRKLIEALASERTILISTHILSEVETLCDRIVLFARGRVIAQGDLDSLRTLAESDQDGSRGPLNLEELFVELTAKAFMEEPV